MVEQALFAANFLPANLLAANVDEAFVLFLGKLCHGPLV